MYYVNLDLFKEYAQTIGDKTFATILTVIDSVTCDNNYSLLNPGKVIVYGTEYIEYSSIINVSELDLHAIIAGLTEGSVSKNDITDLLSVGLIEQLTWDSGKRTMIYNSILDKHFKFNDSMVKHALITHKNLSYIGFICEVNDNKKWKLMDSLTSCENFFYNLLLLTPEMIYEKFLSLINISDYNVTDDLTYLFETGIFNIVNDVLPKNEPKKHFNFSDDFVATMLYCLSELDISKSDN